MSSLQDLVCGEAAEPSLVRLAVPGRPECTTDVFGIPSGGVAHRLPLTTEVRFLIELVAPDCPLGAVRTRVLIDGAGLLTGHPPQGPVEERRLSQLEPMSITAPYAMLLRWLHGDVIFGHLLWSGADIRGDLLDYAAADGIVSAPVEPGPEAGVVRCLLALG